MASAPDGEKSAALCEPAPPAAFAAAAAALEEHAGGGKCEDCGEREGRWFCKDCKGVYCVECDAGTHVRLRRDHVRVPAGEKLLLCPVHKRDAEAYCSNEKRLACGSCILPGGCCFPHAGLVHALDSAAETARKLLDLEDASIVADMNMLKEELATMTNVRTILDIRRTSLEAALAQAQHAHAGLTATRAHPSARLLEDLEPALARAEGARARLNDEDQWWRSWKLGCTSLRYLTLGSKAGVPNLEALGVARIVGGFTVTFVNDISLGTGRSVIIADHATNAPAWEVCLDGSRPPQQLAPVTAHATAVMPLDDGLLTVSWNEGRVERTGTVAWKRTGLLSPYSAAITDTSILVTEYGAGQVSELDLATGTVLTTRGRGVLKQPLGIAIGAMGDFYIAEYQEKCVQVFRSDWTWLRKIGVGRLRSCYGVCVDGKNRVFATDREAKAVLVMDGATGAEIASIPVEGNPVGVVVTRRGEIAITTREPKQLILID